MPYNGSGVYNLYTPGNPVVTGTTISSTWANNTLSDIATGLSTAITKDGQTTTTAVIPFATRINLTSGQLSFPATQVPSSDANTLDDYEEGSWTPSYSGSGAATYSVQSGFYVKIGKLVTASFTITLSNVSTLTGNLDLAGLPFTVGNATGYRSTGTVYWSSLTTSVVTLGIRATENTTTAVFYTATGAVATVQPLNATDLSNTTVISGVISYIATA